MKPEDRAVLLPGKPAAGLPLAGGLVRVFKNSLLVLLLNVFATSVSLFPLRLFPRLGRIAVRVGRPGERICRIPLIGAEIFLAVAAHALGLGEEIGSLKKDKSADIIAIRCDTVESQPIYDIDRQRVYSTSR